AAGALADWPGRVPARPQPSSPSRAPRTAVAAARSVSSSASVSIGHDGNLAAVTSVWLGTAGWSYFPDWVGPFYPEGTRPADALARYAEAFRFVEIDASFYAAPTPETVEHWAEVLPTGFRVSLKAPRELV